MISAKIKYTLLLVLSVISSAACAQSRFKKGDEFQRQVSTKSNCVLQRGSQTLHVSSSSVLVKAYKVTDVTDREASFSITTERLVDTIKAMNQDLVYTSAKAADPNSPIQTGLQKMVSGQSVVSVNNKAEILTVKRQSAVNDTLLSFAGIQPERFVKGTTLQFMVDFPVNPTFKKGYTWKETTPTAETVYTIYAINARTTTITYKTSVLGGNLNSRVNGSMLISNDTGIIMKRYSQSVSTGYEMVNGIVYTATRRTAITEVNTRK
ncbi:MAG: hypothetical protein EOP46_14360 [Sphingobacteriaceae bacterium]|nr:MAG: hypothetical protein EOP46_14360 [Sphingobacteriaceae bacterium]